MAEKKVSVSLEGRMDSLSSTLQRAESETERHTRAMSSSFARLDGGVMSVGRSIGVLATGALAYGLHSVTQAANQTTSAAMGLAVTARYSGVEMAAANIAAKNLTADGLMSVTEASKGLQNLLSRGFSLPEAIQLMNGFKDSAAFGRQASLGFGEAVVTATEGLKNENSILVDNAGVTKNVSVMWKEYAAEHGTTVDKLTQSQKRHAELNGILRETEGQIGNAARMANSFAGAQARAAQESFELKSTLGIALQPAFQGILTIMGPVVSGLRDMVYWVETLGARAGGVYDKIRVRIEEKFRIPKEGEAMGFRERDARIAARDAEIDKNVNAVIDDIVKRSMGGALPDIGADTGKRRQDVVIPVTTTAGEIAKAKQAQKDAMEIGSDMLADYYKDLVRWMKDARETGNGMVDLFQRNRGEVSDDTSMLSRWAGSRANADRESETAGNRFTAERSGLLAGGGSDYQARLDQIKIEEDAYIQSWAMMTDSFEVYESRKVAIEQLSLQKRQALEKTHAQTVSNLQMSAFQNSIGLIQAFAGRSKVAATVALALQKGLAIGETFVSGKAAEIRALAEMGPYAGPPMAATIKAWTLTNMGLIAATGIAEGFMSGGGGGAAGGTGGGTNASPVVTQPSLGSSAPQQGNVTIQINTMIGNDEWVQNQLIPAINQAGSRGVTIEYGGRP